MSAQDELIGACEQTNPKRALCHANSGDRRRMIESIAGSQAGSRLEGKAIQLSRQTQVTPRLDELLPAIDADKLAPKLHLDLDPREPSLISVTSRPSKKGFTWRESLSEAHYAVKLAGHSKTVNSLQCQIFIEHLKMLLRMSYDMEQLSGRAHGHECGDLLDGSVVIT